MWGVGEGEEVVILCYKVPLTCSGHIPRLNSSTFKILTTVNIVGQV